MSEPITTGAAGVAGWKILGGLAGTGVGAGLAAYIVMSMTKPKTDQEWRIALLCTLAGSIGGGAALISWLGLQRWADDVFGLVGMFGIAFACGLPAWLIIRALFLYIDKKRNADITDIVKDVKEMIP
ncbi:hypothetical protein [Massilia sp.]|uniref:hypothetical protein n=1 Tax=Massilia sp. TaxID=1882437 RepID=UPI00352C8BB5